MNDLNPKTMSKTDLEKVAIFFHAIAAIALPSLLIVLFILASIYSQYAKDPSTGDAMSWLFMLFVIPCALICYGLCAIIALICSIKSKNTALVLISLLPFIALAIIGIPFLLSILQIVGIDFNPDWTNTGSLWLGGITYVIYELIIIGIIIFKLYNHIKILYKKRI